MKNPTPKHYTYMSSSICAHLAENFTRRGLELKDDASTQGRQLRNRHTCSHMLLTSNAVAKVDREVDEESNT